MDRLLQRPAADSLHGRPLSGSPWLSDTALQPVSPAVDSLDAAEPASAAAIAQAGVRFSFDRFQVHPEQRALLEEGRPLRLGSRAFDLLVALCRRPGSIVSTQELLAAAWPNQIVDESSVRVHIATLRKALGDGQAGKRYITNVPLRGYCLVSPVEIAGDANPEAATPPVPREIVRPNVDAGLCAPPHAHGLIGRNQESDELMQRLREDRCVTLVGAGGIGKTSVALPVARRFADVEGAAVVIVELGALSHPDLVPMTIASSLGLIISDGQPPLLAIAAFLRGKGRQLIVLDNCEHVIDCVATVAEHILAQVPEVHLLATSRESLRIHGESVQRLESLSLPPPAMQSRAADALQYSAVQLFVKRATANTSMFSMGDAEAPLVCGICRRLDGIPLAIELAAGAIEAVGLRGLVERLGGRLGNRLVMTGRGRRTALPRHQTLRATLDWSFGLLPLEEQELLVHLSIFRGVFTHAAASAVFDRPLESMDACLAALVSKSLVVSEQSNDMAVYRLLETTREYAAERLAASAEANDAATRHARYLLSALRADASDCARLTASSQLAGLARGVEDLRAAIHWAFDAEDTRDLAISLVAWSGPLWFSLSMLSEYRKLADRALEALDTGKPSAVSAEEEMRLCETLGHAIWHTHGGGAAMQKTFSRALAIADRLQATSYQLRCRWGLWLVCNAEADYTGSRRQAEQFGEIAVAGATPAVQYTYERMMALGTHFEGDQARAKEFATRVLKQPLVLEQTLRGTGFHFDQQVAGLTVMARILWLQGNAEQALDHARAAVREAVAIDHALSLCYAIAIGAAPVALWCGYTEQAREWVGLLHRTAHERSLHFWKSFGEGYQQLLEMTDRTQSGADVRSGPAILSTSLHETLCTVQPAFFDEALLERATTGQSGWCTPELLRIQGERQREGGSPIEALETFRKSLELARAQHSHAWILRSSTSLARLLGECGRSAEGVALLDSTLSRFEEGFATPDLQLATRCLETLRRQPE